MDELDNITIPTYIINLKERKDRLNHVLSQFEDRPEFSLNIVEAVEHTNGKLGLWKSIVKVIGLAVENDDDVIIICEDDHEFTQAYSKNKLITNIINAGMQGVNILSGGIGGFDRAVPVGDDRYWIDWFWCTQFIVIYKSFFNAILTEPFLETDTADGKMSEMTSAKMVIYPFISIQKEFGYSDVTLANDVNKGLITELFNNADDRLGTICEVYHKYKDIPL